MKRGIRIFFQKVIIKTSFLPLTYLYKLIYNLAVVIAVILFKKVKGIKAIYLRRGMAKNEIIYGLSDIDLSIIIDDKENIESAKKRIVSIYERLSHFIPLFADVKREMGVYSTSKFFRLYGENPFFKYRFNEGKYTWKLLFGQDLVRELPELTDKELYLPAVEELKEWWPRVSRELILDFGNPSFERKYLWYKAISEAVKVYLVVCHGERIVKRRTALQRVQKYLSSEQNEWIKEMEAYPKKLTSEKHIPVDDLMNLFLILSDQSYCKMEKEVYGETEERFAALSPLSWHDLILDESIYNLIEEVERFVSQKLRSYLDFLALLPQIYLDLDPLYNSDIDSLYLVLAQRSHIPVNYLNELNLLLSQNTSQQAIEPCLTYKNIAVSLQPQNWHQCIKSRKQCPLFFFLLSSFPLHLPSNSNEMSANHMKVSLPPRIEETNKKRIEAINGILSNKNIYKLKTLDLLRFFWGAARAKLLAHSLKNGQVYIPLTSKQILEMLSQFFYRDSNWLKSLHKEYTKELRGQESKAVHFYQESVEFLKRL